MRSALLLVALTACTSEGSSPNTCAEGDAESTIVSSTVRDQFLQLEIQYAGGCEDHRLSLLWAGVGAASNPPQIPLYLQHFGNGDSCEASISTTVWFDLSPIHALPIPAGTEALLSIKMSPETRSLSLIYPIPAAEGAAPAEGAVMLQTCRDQGV